MDPSHRVRGWRETAIAVETERAQFDTNAFIIADHYGTTGLYSFYSPPARAAANAHTPLVYCLIPISRSTSFPFGTNTITARIVEAGMPFLFCDSNLTSWNTAGLENGCATNRSATAKSPHREPVPDRIAGEFETVTNLGVREIKLRDGRIFQRVQIFGCYHLK